MTHAAINTNTTVHGNIRNNMNAKATGQVSIPEIAIRGNRAAKVLRDYRIIATGSKTNGWGEAVEAYTLTKPNGSGYEVQIRANGEPSCNCMDWTRRRHIHGGFCKHAVAITAIRNGDA